MVSVILKLPSQIKRILHHQQQGFVPPHLLIFLALVLAVGGWWAYQNILNVRPAKLYFDNQIVAPKAASEFVVPVIVDTGGKQILSIRTFIHYDPQKLTVIDSDSKLAGTQINLGQQVFEGQVVLVNKVNEITGEIEIALAAPAQDNAKAFSGKAALALIKFMAKSNGPVSLSFDTQARDVVYAKDNQVLRNVLGQVESTTLKIIKNDNKVLSAIAQAGQGTITGYVLDQSGIGVAGVQIYVFAEQYFRATVESNGSYTLNAPEGKQDVYVDEATLPQGAQVSSPNPVQVTSDAANSATARFSIKRTSTAPTATPTPTAGAREESNPPRCLSFSFDKSQPAKLGDKIVIAATAVDDTGLQELSVAVRGPGTANYGKRDADGMAGWTKIGATQTFGDSRTSGQTIVGWDTGQVNVGFGAYEVAMFAKDVFGNENSFNNASDEVWNSCRAAFFLTEGTPQAGPQTPVGVNIPVPTIPAGAPPANWPKCEQISISPPGTVGQGQPIGTALEVFTAGYAGDGKAISSIETFIREPSNQFANKEGGDAMRGWTSIDKKDLSGVPPALAIRQQVTIPWDTGKINNGAGVYEVASVVTNRDKASTNLENPTYFARCRTTVQLAAGAKAPGAGPACVSLVVDPASGNEIGDNIKVVGKVKSASDLRNLRIAVRGPKSEDSGKRTNLNWTDLSVDSPGKSGEEWVTTATWDTKNINQGDGNYELALYAEDDQGNLTLGGQEGGSCTASHSLKFKPDAPVCSVADANGDWKVDAADVAYVIRDYGKDSRLSNFKGYGTVDVTDYTMLLSTYGQKSLKSVCVPKEPPPIVATPGANANPARLSGGGLTPIESGLADNIDVKKKTSFWLISS